MSKIAAYPGGFDPITNGHLDIVRRASQMFDRVVVAVASSVDKHPLFDIDERIDMVQKAVAGLRNVRVDRIDGLLVDYVRCRTSNLNSSLPS